MKKIILFVVILLFIDCTKNSKTQISPVTPIKSNSFVNAIQTVKSNNKNFNYEKFLSKFFSIDVLSFRNKLIIIGNRPSVDDRYENKVQIWSSVDGITWLKEVDDLMNPWRESYAIANNSDKIIIIGGQFANNNRTDELYYTENIRDWKMVKQDTTFGAIAGQRVFYFQNKFWLIGGKGKNHQQLYDIWSSNEGLEWQKDSNNLDWKTSIDIDECNVNNEYFFYFAFGKLYKTNDSINWKQLDIKIETVLNITNYNLTNSDIDFCYLKSFVYLAVCINSWAEDTGFTGGYVPTTVIYRSNNLTDWELLSKKKDIPYINGKSEYKLMYDSLPFHWNAGFISFKDHLYIIGTDGDVWRSKDGVKWELISGNLPVFENRGD